MAADTSHSFSSTGDAAHHHDGDATGDNQAEESSLAALDADATSSSGGGDKGDGGKGTSAKGSTGKRQSSTTTSKDGSSTSSPAGALGPYAHPYAAAYAQMGYMAYPYLASGGYGYGYPAALAGFGSPVGGVSASGTQGIQDTRAAHAAAAAAHEWAARMHARAAAGLPPEPMPTIPGLTTTPGALASASASGAAYPMSAAAAPFGYAWPAATAAAAAGPQGAGSQQTPVAGAGPYQYPSTMAYGGYAYALPHSMQPEAATTQAGTASHGTQAAPSSASASAPASSSSGAPASTSRA